MSSPSRLRLVHSRPTSKRASVGADLGIALPFIVALAIAVIAGIGAARAAHALTAEDASMLQDNLRREPSASRKIRMEGLLSCSFGTQNSGEPCEVKLKELSSGRTFKLRGTATAQSLFHSGRKKVAVEGSLADAETIDISQIQAL